MHLQKLWEKIKMWFEIGTIVCQQGWSTKLHIFTDSKTFSQRLRGFPANLHKTTCASTHPHAIRKSPWIKHQALTFVLGDGWGVWWNHPWWIQVASKCCRIHGSNSCFMRKSGALCASVLGGSFEQLKWLSWFKKLTPPQTQSFLQKTRELLTEPVDARCTCKKPSWPEIWWRAFQDPFDLSYWLLSKFVTPLCVKWV